MKKNKIEIRGKCNNKLRHQQISLVAADERLNKFDDKSAETPQSDREKRWREKR